MAFDPILGLSMDGNELPLLPPNASNDQQITVLNRIIAELNNVNRDGKVAGTVTFTATGLDSQPVLIIPHNLAYTPRAYVYLDRVKVTLGNGEAFPDVTIPLPTYLKETGVGVGGDGFPVIDFGVWLDFWVDDTNLYIHCINAASQVISENISYILYKKPATS